MKNYQACKVKFVIHVSTNVFCTSLNGFILQGQQSKHYLLHITLHENSTY